MKTKKIKKVKYSCPKCKAVLEYKPTIFITAQQRVCKKCNHVMYVDHSPIKWDLIAEK